MEAAQLISDEWDSLSGQYTAEEADFMTQFLGGNYSFTGKDCGNGNTSFGIPSYFPSNVDNANSMCFSQVSSTNTTNSADIFSTTTNSGIYFSDQATNTDSLSMLLCLGEDAKLSPQYLDDSFGKQINYESIGHERSCLEPGNNLHAKREYEMMMVSEPSSEENPVKRFRSSNGSMELNEGKSPSLSPKLRARNGPATDSQSIYARRRRERINERLRILQTLVPNGTKVDISTMLEEAVQYVKFLQLQIKVLSSDDMWMYAPIAYNGINIGLDLTFS